MTTRDAFSLSMERHRLSRAGAVVAALAAVGWLTVSIDSIVRPHPHNYRDLALVAPWILTMGALTLIHRLQHQTTGRAEQLGYWTVMATMAASVPVEIGLGLGWKGFTDTAGPAAILWIPAMLLFGVATARGRVIGVVPGLAIAFAEPMTIAAAVAMSGYAPLADNGIYTGAVMHGVVLLLVATRLARIARSGHRVVPETNAGAALVALG